jgi:DNA-binding transcriptional ArsR family regulator
MTEDTIEIGTDGETLPVEEVLTGRAFLTGKSGSGKSNSASVVAEELLSMGLPLVIVDTDGEYWGLKEQFEVLHVGADEDCDLQVGPEHAEKLASLALEENVPIILDVSGYLESETADALVREVARHLFNKEKKLKKPFLLIIEEIHEYVPQKRGMDDVGEMLIRVAKRGRKRGLGMAGVSQRPASVDKDYITQCDWLVWHRLTWENEIKVVKRVLGNEYEDPIKELDDGEAFVQADFMDQQARRVQWKRKQTFDAGATPGLEEIDRPDLKSVSADLVDDLEAITEREERRQDRIAQLEATIDEKDERIAELEEEVERAHDMSDMAQQFTEAMTQSAGGEGAEAIQERVEEIREEKQAEIRELTEERDDLREKNDELQRRIQDLQNRVDELQQYEQAVENLEELEEAVVRMNEALGLEADGDTEKYRKKLEQKDERIGELEAKIDRLESQGYSLDEEFSEKMDFIRHEAVREEIGRASEKMKTKEDHTWDVISVLIDKGQVQIDDVAPFVDVTRSSVSGILSKLQTHGVVKKRQDGNQVYYTLNVDGMKDIIQQQRKRTEMEQLKNSVKEEVKDG